MLVTVLDKERAGTQLGHLVSTNIRSRTKLFIADFLSSELSVLCQSVN